MPAGQQPQAQRPATPAMPSTQPVHRPEAHAKLSSYLFSDMYLPSDQKHPVMVRGLRSSDVLIGAYRKGLVRAPGELLADVAVLHDTIHRKWEHCDWAREFTVTHDGQAYRCSLIAPPNFDWTAGSEDEEDAGLGKRVEWCVRQVSARVPNFDDLKLPQWAREDIDRLTDMRGLVLIAGPFASGKTTLASSVFDYWVSRSRDVGITLEDPPEIPMERTTEDHGKIIQIDLLDKSIRMAIKNARRWAPRYVFLGEVRTSDVSAELMHMAISGPLTICTIHASDPVQAIVSLFRFTSEAMSEEMARAMIASSLHQVFHQEIHNGRAILKTARLWGPDAHLIKVKIGSGNFKGLYEDFDRQSINRSNGS